MSDELQFVARGVKARLIFSSTDRDARQTKVRRTLRKQRWT